MEAATTAREGRTSAGGEAILEVKNIEVVFNDVILVLRGLSLEARRGGITALLGANGAGKSTTLKAISGLLAVEDGAITRGSVSFDGEEITRLPPNRIVQRGIFQVMEGRGIVQDMTVIENLRLGAHTRRSARVGDDMDQVFDYFPRLKERTGLAGYLSGGEQQMLAIGRALMARPRLILMDEPSMGLSPLLVLEVFAIIRRLNRDLGISILLVEQNANMALQTADYGYVLEVGRIVMADTCQRLLEKEDIKEFYLGIKEQGARGKRRWKKRKTWR
jgi:branched-chain amino acid transport system ATP-binding protein